MGSQCWFPIQIHESLYLYHLPPHLCFGCFHLYLYSSVIIPNADHCSDPGLFPICSTSRSLYLCSIAPALYTTSLIPPDRSSFRHHESFNQRFTFNSTKCEEQIHDGKIHTSCNDQTPCITQCTTTNIRQCIGMVNFKMFPSVFCSIQFCLCSVLFWWIHYLELTSDVLHGCVAP